MAVGKGILPATEALPRGENARTLYEKVSLSAFVDVTFASDPVMPVRWWNWYMTSPHWGEFFRTGVFSGGVQTHGKSVPAGGESTFMVTPDRRPESVEDMPGPLDDGAILLLGRITDELSNRGVARLRGEHMRLPEEG